VDGVLRYHRSNEAYKIVQLFDASKSAVGSTHLNPFIENPFKQAQQIEYPCRPASSNYVSA